MYNSAFFQLEPPLQLLCCESFEPACASIYTQADKQAAARSVVEILSAVITVGLCRLTVFL